MNTHLLRFLQHQDAFNKNIKSVEELNDHEALVELWSGDTWFASDGPVDHAQDPYMFKRIYIGLHSLKLADVFPVVDAARKLEHARIIIFDEEGRKITHIVPFNYKNYDDEAIKRTVEKLLSHAG